VKRFGKILCGFGLVEFLCAVVVLFIFERVPSPWGAGTLPGGLQTVGAPDPVETAMEWQAHVLAGIAAFGFMGLGFLLVGIIAYIVSKTGMNRGHS
jgi:hypothetical protein